MAGWRFIVARDFKKPRRARRRRTAHRLLEGAQQLVERWLVTAVLHEMAGVPHGGAVAAEGKGNPGQAHAKPHMAQIHRHLAGESGIRRTATWLQQTLREPKGKGNRITGKPGSGTIVSQPAHGRGVWGRSGQLDHRAALL